jgi:hypothetical protein
MPGKTREIPGSGRAQAPPYRIQQTCQRAPFGSLRKTAVPVAITADPVLQRGGPGTRVAGPLEEMASHIFDGVWCVRSWRRRAVNRQTTPPGTRFAHPPTTSRTLSFECTRRDLN